MFFNLGCLELGNQKTIFSTLDASNWETNMKYMYLGCLVEHHDVAEVALFLLELGNQKTFFSTLDASNSETKRPFFQLWMPRMVAPLLTYLLTSK